MLKIPKRTFWRWGIADRSGSVRTGGATMGRVNLLYPSEKARDGLTIININDNAGKSILRFVTHNGCMMVNGRIYGVKRVLVHGSSPRAILKGLLKLLAHGAKH